jgi:hypothetical protein
MLGGDQGSDTAEHDEDADAPTSENPAPTFVR